MKYNLIDKSFNKLSCSLIGFQLRYINITEYPTLTSRWLTLMSLSIVSHLSSKIVLPIDVCIPCERPQDVTPTPAYRPSIKYCPCIVDRAFPKKSFSRSYFSCHTHTQTLHSLTEVHVTFCVLLKRSNLSYLTFLGRGLFFFLLSLRFLCA